MLVLTRREGESIKIGDNVTVTIGAIKGNQVQIKVCAPREMEVDREEIRNLKNKKRNEKSKQFWKEPSRDKKLENKSIDQGKGGNDIDDSVVT